MNAHGPDTVSLHSLLHGNPSPIASNRSSFDYASLSRQDCSVSIFDHTSDIQPLSDSDTTLEDASIAHFRLPHSPLLSTLPDDLKRRLDKRDILQTRWINVTGWSPGLVDDLTNRFLENHGCLDLEDLGAQTIGGPIRCNNGSYFIWVQTSIWYAGQQTRYWSSAQKCRLRLVICLPTSEKAGTVITNFLGHLCFAEEVSRAFSQGLLDNHSMGAEALSCPWVLACSILRLTAEQLNLAFRVFDPIECAPTSIPQSSDLPLLLEIANDLSRIDRYISGLDEIAKFFDVVRTFQQSQIGGSSVGRWRKENRADDDKAAISPRSILENALAKEKIAHAQQMCRTYIKQYESQVTLMLSFTSTQIIQRLDGGQKLGERLTVIGLALAAVTVLSTPFAMVTGYYGMNVQELVEGSLPTLFDFWQTALPVLGASISLLCMGSLRLLSNHKSLRTHSTGLAVK